MRRSISTALRLGSLFLAGLLCAPTARAQDEATVGIDGGGDAFLYGSLLRPEGDAPAPFVLIAPALGSTDRDGNPLGGKIRPDTYKLLAQGLAARGIGSLRIDRRGVAGSTAAAGDEANLRFDTYVDDIVAWARFLALQPRVKCVVLLGHSEGALMAALASQKVKACAVIEVAGSGRTAGDMMQDQLKAAEASGKLSEETYKAAVRKLGELRAGRTVSDVPLQLASLFRPSLQPYLISWLNRDPIAAERDIEHLLILQGDRDTQVNSDDARKLANVNRRIKLAVLPGVNHELKLAAATPAIPAPPPAAAAPYSTDAAKSAAGVALATEQPLAPSVAPTIADFIAKAL